MSPVRAADPSDPRLIGQYDPSPHQPWRRPSVEGAGEARAILTELLMVDPREETTLWLLRGSILSAVDHVLEPLKLEDRARLLEKQKPRKSRVTKPGDVLTRDMLAPEQGGRLRALATRPVDASRSAERALRRAAGRRPWRRRE